MVILYGLVQNNELAPKLADVRPEKTAQAEGMISRRPHCEPQCEIGDTSADSSTQNTAKKRKLLQCVVTQNFSTSQSRNFVIRWSDEVV